MREILDLLPVGLIYIGKGGAIEYANRFCLERGLVSENHKGRKYYEATRCFALIGAVREFLERKGQTHHFEHEGRTFRTTPLSDRILMIEDISKEVRLDRLQREFTASVSHELGTPLTAIKGLLETALLQETPSRELLERVLKRVEDLERLISSLRFLVLLDTAQKLVRERFPLKDLMNEILEDLKEEIAQKGLEVESVGKEAVVENDREKLYVLLKNLIENAVRYNREGGRVSIRVEEIGKKVRIVIEDTGEGIPREDIPLIFQPFFGGKNKKGMGLGLAISKKIADFLGAELRMRSEEGKGTVAEILLH